LIHRWVRRGLWTAIVVGLTGLVAVVGSVGWIRYSARGHIYDEASVPAAPVALVLGAPVYDGGSPSPFLAARLDVARRLYDAGRVRAILVSGDHGRWEYSEPDAMREYLIAHGVPGRKVVADYAGFDTYDSCARARRIFGVRRAIVVTQSFHIARAVTLCRRLGLDVDGVGDDSVRVFAGAWRKGSLREKGAAVKAAFDVLTGRDPVYLGRYESGVDDALR
jgi:vancomycin permeability regulator SanA